MKKKKYIIVLIVVLICFSVFIAVKMREKDDNSPYISVTASRYGDTQEQILTGGYVYDFKTQKSEKIFEFEYDAQYPLMTYDKSDNTVYYVKPPSEDQDKNEIFAYNLSNHTERQLTEDLFAVNIIAPTENKIFFAGRKIKQRNINLGAIDKSTGEITYWRDDKDTAIESFSIDYNTGKIYMSSYSKQNRDKYVLLPDWDGQDDHIVYETDFDFSYTKEIYYGIKEQYSQTIPNNGKLLILKSSSRYPEQGAIYIDLETGVQEDFTLPDIRIRQGGAFFSEDGKNLYFIGASKEDKYPKVYEYNVSTKKCKSVFYAGDDSYINNMMYYN